MASAATTPNDPARVDDGPLPIRQGLPGHGPRARLLAVPGPRARPAGRRRRRSVVPGQRGDMRCGIVAGMTLFRPYAANLGSLSAFRMMDCGYC